MSIKDFRRTIVYTNNLKEEEFEKLYEAIFIYFSDTVEEFCLKRHKELQNQGMKNQEIFKLLKSEISKRLFKGPSLSERQLKRIIYKN